MNRVPLCILVALGFVLGGCGTTATLEDEHDAAGSDDSWAVTAWGEQFEIFAEADALVAGAVATSHTHITLLSDFSPLREGVVSAILRSSDGMQESFRQDLALRDGIFSIDITPEREGLFDLFFKIETSSLQEEIPAGQVRVGPPEKPGGLVASAAMPAVSEEPISFLKEQQWRTEFSTTWVQEGTLRQSVRGPGRVRPVAGGEILLTAPVGGSVLGSPWPFTGLNLGRDAVVFRLTPEVASDHSLAELEAATLGIEAEFGVASARASRLGELLALGAVSEHETEENRAQLTTLEAQLEAARRDLESARALRQNTGSSTETLEIAAPFSGRISEVSVTPGQAVSAGTALARLVRAAPLWVEVALRPEAAHRVIEPTGLYLRISGAEEPLLFSADEVSLISQSPGVDPATGTVGVLFEVQSTVDDLPLWSAVEAEILLRGAREGIVIPSSALVDDGGVTVVYVQPSGESFLRREVHVVARQGSEALVERLTLGDRLVTRGGNSIRRATLVAAGPGEGHVH